MSQNPPPPRSPWFPFSWGELEVAIGVVGAIAGLASYSKVPVPLTFLLVAFVSTALYLAGLLIRTRESVRTFEFLEEGAVKGEGYVPYLRKARRSLFLTHVDEDAPSDELLAVYRTLLGRGVEMRRVIFLREGGAGTAWVGRFGRNDRLLQRAIPPGRGEVMRLSFVVVDEETVLVSLPGFSQVDQSGYARGFVLRHLVVMHDRSVAQVFLRMHGDLWSQGHSIASPEDLGPA